MLDILTATFWGEVAPGLVASIRPWDTTLKLDAGEDPNFTPSMELKPDPYIFTVVPPDIEPDDGLIWSSTGGAGAL